MRTKCQLLILVVAVAMISTRCAQNADTPQIPTSIEDNFKAGIHTYEGVKMSYQECSIDTQQTGKHSLVVVLHGQYANGSDNKSQLNQDAMIRIWHYLYSNNVKSVMLAPQCPVGRTWDEQKQSASLPVMAACVKSLIDYYIVKKPNIDTSRIYIIGYSDANEPAGAGGVWQMLSNYTDIFAAGMSVAADPDDSISATKIAKTPLLLVKGISDIHAVAVTLDSFADMVRDAGGIIREDVLHVNTRADLCREAFSQERMNWIMQYNK